MQRRRFLPTLALGFLLSTGVSHALTLKDITIPEQLAFEDVTLSLNGAGVRSKFFVDAYVACLYLLSPSDDSERVLESDEPQAITLHITSNRVTNKRLAKAAERDMRKVMGGSLEPIQAQVDLFMSLFDGEVSAGDVFKLVYRPDVGVSVIQNDRKLGVIPGLGFKKALFGIWLSEKNPALDDLREELLHGDAGDV